MFVCWIDLGFSFFLVFWKLRVHTNFVFEQLNENLYNKLQNFDFFKDVDSISGCSSQRTSSDSSLREL